MKQMKRMSVGLILLGLTMPIRGEWFFEVGPFYRGGMELSVEGGSRAVGMSAGAVRPGSTQTGGSSAGPLLNDTGASAELRTFDNGFVGPSGWEWARNDGITQFFAYDTADQYNAGTDTLMFQRTVRGGISTQTRTSYREVSREETMGWTERQKTEGRGLMATLGYTLNKNAEAESPVTWSLLLRLGWLEGMDAAFRDRPAYRFRQVVEERRDFSSTLREETYAYTYDTLGNPFFPSAPYAMTSPSGVGPMISDTPDSIVLQSQRTLEGDSNESIRTALFTARSTVDLDVEVSAFTLQAGPRLQWDAHGSFSMHLQPMLTLNHLETRVRREERLVDGRGKELGAWSDKANDQSFRWGAGLQIGARLAVSKGWSLLASGGYEWVETSYLTVGPDRIDIDLSGYQIEMALGWNF